MVFIQDSDGRTTAIEMRTIQKTYVQVSVCEDELRRETKRKNKRLDYSSVKKTTCVEDLLAGGDDLYEDKQREENTRSMRGRSEGK